MKRRDSICFDDGLICEQVLNTFVAYDNRSAGQRAMQLVCDLERESRKDIQPLLWRFDVLADPDCQQLAAADAMRADLLIISTVSHELPALVRSWLTASLSRETLTQSALVALLGEQGQTVEASLPGLMFLQNVAKNAGLAFFAPSPSPAADLHCNRHVAQSQQGPLEMIQLTDRYQHWA